MMLKAKYKKQTGEIIGIASHIINIQDTLDNECDYINYYGEKDFKNFYVNLETMSVEKRPKLEKISQSKILDFSYLDTNFTVVIRNEAGDKITTTDFTEPLILTDDGLYFLKIYGPFPWITFEQTLEF